MDPSSSEAPLGQVRSGYLKIRTLTVESGHPRPDQDFPDFEIIVDYKIRFEDEAKVLYMLLGFEDERDRKVGLVLSANSDGSYSRIGQFRSSKTLDKIPVEENGPWDKRTLTLV